VNKYNERKINNFRLTEKDCLKDIYRIKEEAIERNDVELVKYIESLEAISNIIEIDELMIFTGIIYSIRDTKVNELLNENNFDIEFEKGIKLKLPFFMKKGLGTPLYYIDLAKTNNETFEKTKKMLSLEEIEIDLTRFNDVFNLTNYRKINISQQTFLAGYILGYKYLNKKMTFELFYESVKKCYKGLHEKHK